jgi:hypothetical protein
LGQKIIRGFSGKGRRIGVQMLGFQRRHWHCYGEDQRYGVQNLFFFIYLCLIIRMWKAT